MLANERARADTGATPRLASASVREAGRTGRLPPYPDRRRAVPRRRRSLRPEQPVNRDRSERAPPARHDLTFHESPPASLVGPAYGNPRTLARDDFCLHTVGSKPGRDRVTTGAHIAFCASDASSVVRWHDAAMDNGGTDIGPPGVRPDYSGYYYAAFVIDPDGNNVEAVFHTSADVVAEQ